MTSDDKKALKAQKRAEALRANLQKRKSAQKNKGQGKDAEPKRKGS